MKPIYVVGAYGELCSKAIAVGVTGQSAGYPVFYYYEDQPTVKREAAYFVQESDAEAWMRLKNSLEAP